MGMIKRFSYIGKTFPDIVEECKARIKEKYPDLWNDYYEDNAGMMILEIFGYVVDLLLYYGDRQALETYLPTAQERQNLINICKLIGYKVSGASAASVTLTFSVDGHSTPITIPAGTQIETKNGIVFELDSDVVIAADGTSATGTAKQGETKEAFLGTSDGSPSQVYILEQEGIVEIKEINVGGQEWKVVESLLEEDSISQCCIVELGSDGRAVITFGDGTNGMSPEEGSDIKITYRVTDGAEGNVTANTVTEMRSTAVDTNGNRIAVSVTNEEAAAGGADPESIARIKSWAPKNFTTQGRCVTGEDYETKAMAFPDSSYGRIAKCKAVVTEQTGAANVVTLYILSYGTSGIMAASEALKSALKKYIEEYAMLTTWIEVADGSTSDTEIAGTVQMYSGFREEDVKPKVEAALSALFDPEIREMGQTMRISDIYGALEAVSGVDFIELTTPTASITAEESQLLTLGAVNLSYVRA